MPIPRSPWVSAQAAHLDRLITEQRSAYEGNAFWDWARDQFVRYMVRYVRPGSRVLDIGCGDGYYASRLAESERVARILAIDVSRCSIDYART